MGPCPALKWELGIPLGRSIPWRNRSFRRRLARPAFKFKRPGWRAAQDERMNFSYLVAMLAKMPGTQLFPKALHRIQPQPLAQWGRCADVWGPPASRRRRQPAGANEPGYAGSALRAPNRVPRLRTGPTAPAACKEHQNMCTEPSSHMPTHIQMQHPRKQRSANKPLQEPRRVTQESTQHRSTTKTTPQFNKSADPTPPHPAPSSISPRSTSSSSTATEYSPSASAAQPRQPRAGTA